METETNGETRSDTACCQKRVTKAISMQFLAVNDVVRIAICLDIEEYDILRECMYYTVTVRPQAKRNHFRESKTIP